MKLFHLSVNLSITSNRSDNIISLSDKFAITSSFILSFSLKTLVNIL